MQEMKPTPTPKTPGFRLLNQLHSLFLRKADSKIAEAQQLLNPQTFAPANLSDSLDTGKLNKLINYIKGGMPTLVLILTAFSEVF